MCSQQQRSFLASSAARTHSARLLPLRSWGALFCGLVGATALSGCMPNSEVNFERYTLIQDVSPMVYESRYQAEVKLPPILDQGGVVLQISDVSLRPAKNYRFSSSLAAELMVLLQNELIKTDIDPRYKFTLYVTKFQGTLDGEVIVEALAQVSDLTKAQTSKTTSQPQGKTVFSKAYLKEGKLQGDGYDALVQALKQNYIELTQDLIHDFSEQRHSTKKPRH